MVDTDVQAPRRRTYRRDVSPEEVLDESARRLAASGWMLAAAWFVYVGLSLLSPPPAASASAPISPFVVRMVGGLLGIGVAVFVALRTSGRQHPPSRLVSAGALLLWSLGLFGSLGTYSVGDSNGWSGLAVAIALFPVMVPAEPRRALVVGLVAVALSALGVVVSGLLRGANVAPVGVLLGVRGELIASGIGFGVAVVVGDMQARLEKARRLGSYELQERLGVGGMGEVWKARHGSLARPAAIKLIKTSVGEGMSEASHDAIVQRFTREAQATASLRSPHTVEVYDYGESDDGTLYYAMELLEGVDLDEAIKRGGPMAPARVVHLLLQVCSSLQEAHERGMVHRDIKAANVYLCRYEGELDFVKVLDFGLVKVVEDAESTRLTGDGVAGTPGYLAPEQGVHARDVDARADLYALGCVAYWLLTGKLVFEARSGAEMILRHISDPPLPPGARVGHAFPTDLETIIMKCLEKEPEDRIQTADELSEALRATGLAELWTQTLADEWWTAWDEGRPMDAGTPDWSETLAASSGDEEDRPLARALAETASTPMPELDPTQVD